MTIRTRTATQDRAVTTQLLRLPGQRPEARARATPDREHRIHFRRRAARPTVVALMAKRRVHREPAGPPLRRAPAQVRLQGRATTVHIHARTIAQARIGVGLASSACWDFLV